MTQSSPKLLSPIADRDLLVMGGVCAFWPRRLMVVNAELVLAAGIAAALLGGPAAADPRPTGGSPPACGSWPTPTTPAADLGPPWTAARRAPRRVLGRGRGAAGAHRRRRDPGRRAGLAAVGAHPCRACHPPSRSAASCRCAAARRTAAWTRPGLSAATAPGPRLERGRGPAAPRPDRRACARR